MKLATKYDNIDWSSSNPEQPISKVKEYNYYKILQILYLKPEEYSSYLDALRNCTCKILKHCNNATYHYTDPKLIESVIGKGKPKILVKVYKRKKISLSKGVSNNNNSNDGHILCNDDKHILSNNDRHILSNDDRHILSNDNEQILNQDDEQILYYDDKQISNYNNEPTLNNNNVSNPNQDDQEQKNRSSENKCQV
ncbi:14408_t:CDS:2, partial [Cetraspora pellucida]